MIGLEDHTALGVNPDTGVGSGRDPKSNDIKLGAKNNHNSQNSQNNLNNLSGGQDTVQSVRSIIGGKIGMEKSSHGDNNGTVRNSGNNTTNNSSSTNVLNNTGNNTGSGSGVIINDHMGDIRLVEGSSRDGREVMETGPSHRYV